MDPEKGFTNVPKHYAARTHEKMREVLMNPDAEGPAVHYYMMRGDTDQRNITVWESGTVGGEYIKTYGHYHVGELDETYWILFGDGVALLQKRGIGPGGEELPDVIEDFKAVQVARGDTLYMPSGYGHLVANVGSTYFVTADDGPIHYDEPDPASLPGHADYKPVQAMQGFAYYVVAHNGKPALKKNPRYKEVRNADVGGLPVVV